MKDNRTDINFITKENVYPKFEASVNGFTCDIIKAEMPRFATLQDSTMTKSSAIDMETFSIAVSGTQITLMCLSPKPRS